MVPVLSLRLPGWRRSPSFQHTVEGPRWGVSDCSLHLEQDEEETRGQISYVYFWTTIPMILQLPWVRGSGDYTPEQFSFQYMEETI